MQAACIDAEMVRVRTRLVKGFDATHAAKPMRGGAGIKPVFSQAGLPAQQLKVFFWHQPVQVSQGSANAAIAVDQFGLFWQPATKQYRLAMTTAIDPCPGRGFIINTVLVVRA